MVARPLTTDEWQVMVRLERWKAEIEALLRLLAGRSHLGGADAERAREMFGYIKHGLRDECEAGAKLRGYDQLSNVERRWYHPTIRMAYATLQSKINTGPGGRWAAELSQAAQLIGDALAVLHGSDGGSVFGPRPANTNAPQPLPESRGSLSRFPSAGTTSQR